MDITKSKNFFIYGISNAPKMFQEKFDRTMEQQMFFATREKGTGENKFSQLY